MDNFGVGGIDQEQLVAEQVSQVSEGAAHDKNKDLTQDQDAGDPLFVSRAVVLAGEADGGLMEGVHGGIDEALDVAGSRISRHGHGAEGIDGGLDQHVGDGKDRALHSRGKADADHQDQAGFMDLQFVQVQAVHAFLADQAAQDQKGGNALGDHGGDGHAGDAHMENDDEDQVQDDVHHAGGEQEVQGAFGVAHRPQDGRAEVVEHGGGHTDEIDPHVQRRLIQHVVRRAHEGQKRLCQKDADENQDHAAHQA